LVGPHQEQKQPAGMIRPADDLSHGIMWQSFDHGLNQPAEMMRAAEQLTTHRPDVWLGVDSMTRSDTC
ncbi:MAG: hypothetical protein ABGZ17_27770, partial [Planctomycetaceae bacterium]